MSHPAVSCPKCGRRLPAAGELVVDQVTLPVYQCDECLVAKPIMGEPFEVALTFCVGPDGRAFDPADPETPLTFPGVS